MNRVKANIGRLSLTLLLMGVMGVGLAACGGEAATPTPTTAAVTNGSTDSTPATDGQGSSGSAQEIKAKLVEWAIEMSATEANAGKVKFITTNEGQFPHNLVVLDSTGAEIQEIPKFTKDEGVKTMEIDLMPGSYKVVCDLPGHTEKGMTTDLTVK